MRADRAGIARLLRSLNELLGDATRTEKQLEESLDVWWKVLEKEFEQAKKSEEARRGRPVAEPMPTVDDRLRSIEELIRTQGTPPSTDRILESATIDRIVERVIVRYVAKRRRLPDRRAGYIQQAMIGGSKVTFRTGEFDDGSLGEIQLELHKESPAFRSIISAFTTAVSIALQYGVPLQEYVDEFLNTRFEPNGNVEGNPYLKMSTSILDYAFRELAITYLNRHDLADVVPDDLRGDSGEFDEFDSVEEEETIDQTQDDSAITQAISASNTDGDKIPNETPAE